MAGRVVVARIRVHRGALVGPRADALGGQGALFAVGVGDVRAPLYPVDKEAVAGLFAVGGDGTAGLGVFRVGCANPGGPVVISAWGAMSVAESRTWHWGRASGAVCGRLGAGMTGIVSACTPLPAAHL